MKKLTRGVLGGLAVSAVAIFASAGPAMATIDFSSASWTVNDVIYSFESTGSDTYGGIEYTETTTQSTASLGYEETNWGGGDLSGWNTYGYCYSTDATETTEANGDVVITCAPYELDNDVWFSQEYRMYSDHKLWRHIQTLENRGTAAADLDAADQYNYLYMYQSESGLAVASSDPTPADPSTCLMTSDDHWMVFAGDSDTTITGWAFQAAGETTWDGDGQDCASSPSVYLATDSLAAGQKMHFMSLIATGEPAGSTTGDMDTAFAAFVTGMSDYDKLNDTLCRGLADGTAIAGWGTCGPAALPDTGVNSTTATVTGIGAMAALLAGAAVLIVVRRRQAQH